MEVDDIFGYDKLVAAEKATLQKGMNYRVGKDYSVFLMSLRENAAFAEQSRWSTSLPSGSLRMNNVSATRQDLQRFRNDLDDDRSDRECGDFCRVDRSADAGGTAPHRAARFALRRCDPDRSGGGGTNYSRRHRDSSALAQSGRRNHPVPFRAANAFRATGFQPRIARAGARPGRVSAGGAFHRGTGRDNGGDPADG